MVFATILGVGVLALLLLQQQSKGAPTGQGQPVKSTVAQGKNVAPVAYQSSQLLAMGFATLGTDRNPATINLTADTMNQGSPNPQGNLGANVPAGFNLTSMLDNARTVLGAGLRGQPDTSPSGGQPSGQIINAPIGTGPQSSAVIYPAPSNANTFSSGILPLPSGYASPNTPQSSLVGNFIPAANVGSPTTAPLAAPKAVPSAPNTPVGSPTPPSLGVTAPPPVVAPFQIGLSAPSSPLVSASAVGGDVFPFPTTLGGI